MTWRLETEWSLMSLNGCPDELFADVYDVATAAAHDITLDEASALESRLWNAQFDTRDRQVGCLLDAWRSGLLLYCARVFKLPPRPFANDKAETENNPDDLDLMSDDLDAMVDDMDEITNALDETTHDSDENPSDATSSSSHRKPLAEEILRLISLVPNDSNLQKQCLFPVIMPGCEMNGTDQLHLRNVATDFCNRWADLSGTYVSKTGLELMRKVWGLMDTSAGDV